MFTHVILSVREGFPKEETWMSIATHVLHFEKLVAYVACCSVAFHRVGVESTWPSTIFVFWKLKLIPNSAADLTHTHSVLPVFGIQFFLVR